MKLQNCKKATLHLHVAMTEKLIIEIFILSYSAIYISIIKISNNTFWAQNIFSRSTPNKGIHYALILLETAFICPIVDFFVILLKFSIK